MASLATLGVDGWDITNPIIPTLTPYLTTWAAKPLAAAVGKGQRICVSDLGFKLFYSNGTSWVADTNAPLAQTAVAASVTGTTNETTLGTIVVPAGMMGASGMLRITSLWSHVASANAKVLRTRFGGTEFATLTSSVTLASWQSFVHIRNRTAATQVGFPAAGGNSGLGAATVAVTPGAIDTTVDQSILLTGQLASAGETITLEGYTIEVLNA